MRTPEETKLRDEFAGIALRQLMRTEKLCLTNFSGHPDELDGKRRYIAAHAYKMADVMLAMRNQNISKYED